MASRRRKPTSSASRGVSATAGRTAALFPNLEELVIHGEGQISIGAVRPIACAAIANDDHNMLAALVRRPQETLQQLLERLDHAVQLALEDEVFTDEINVASSPSRR